MQTAVQNVEERQLSSAILNRNVYTRTPKSIQTGRKVVDVGMLTIEEVITAKGKRGYAATARVMKRGYERDILAIYKAAEKELIRLGMLKGRNSRDRKYYALHREERVLKARERRAAQRQLKEQMAALPERTT